MRTMFDIDIWQRIIQFFKDSGAWIFGIILSVISYFFEARASFHLLWIAAFFHISMGILKSYVVQNEKFSIRKFADAVLVCSIFTIFLMLVYSNDIANKQDYVSVFAIAAWIITGAYIWHSVIIASSVFSESSIFKIAIIGFKKVFKEKTGIDLKDK